MGVVRAVGHRLGGRFGPKVRRHARPPHIGALLSNQVAVAWAVLDYRTWWSSATLNRLHAVGGKGTRKKTDSRKTVSRKDRITTPADRLEETRNRLDAAVAESRRLNRQMEELAGRDELRELRQTLRRRLRRRPAPRVKDRDPGGSR